MARGAPYTRGPYAAASTRPPKSATDVNVSLSVVYSAERKSIALFQAEIIRFLCILQHINLNNFGFQLRFERKFA